MNAPVFSFTCFRYDARAPSPWQAARLTEAPFGVCLYVHPASEINAASPARDRPRRALVCAPAGDAGALLDTRLTRAGYEPHAAPPDKVVRLAGEFAPDVVVVVLRADAAADDDALALAAQLRANPTTHALPLASANVR